MKNSDLLATSFTKREELAARFATALLSNTVMGDSDLHSSPKEWVDDIIESGFEFADAFLAKLEETK
jgi:hypothetical protein